MFPAQPFASHGVCGTGSRPLIGLLPTAVPLRQRQCSCKAQRGRPSKNLDDGQEDPEPAPAKRKGRKKATNAQPLPPPSSVQAANMPTTVAPDQERVISIENMTSSVELDYTANPTLTVPSYTHQAQGHEAPSQPPLENYVPFDNSPGFVGTEEVGQQRDQLTPQLIQQQGMPQAILAQEQRPGVGQALGIQQQQRQVELGIQAVQQESVGPDVGFTEADEDEDELQGYDDPPGLFDYEAGLAYAVTEPPPENPMQSMPKKLRATSRREADYMLRYVDYLGNVQRQEREVKYIDEALYYHFQQVKETNNMYLTGKALSVVMAEIELEDAQTGNRTDSFYPVWARAEHRWYRSGRFSAYNQYVKENLPELTVKSAPGADQEESFDIMDDVLLMTHDPSGGGDGDGDGDEDISNPAAGLSVDSFMGSNMLPGAGSSELGQAYLEDVLPTTGEEELEEEVL